MALISIAEAFSLILERVQRASVTRVSLNESLGHYLAEDVRADRDWPPFHRSAVDGYAVFSPDTRAAPDVLELIDEVAAGKVSSRAISPGQTIKIMTGAPLPPGANAVVMREHVEIPREGFVRFKAAARAGQHIARQASDSRAGEIVIRSGTQIGAAEIGVLAAVGCVEVPVRRMPSAAILGTGDEVVEPYETPGRCRFEIRTDASCWRSVRQTAWLRAISEFAPDDRAATRGLVEDGLRAELFISTGGVSVGDHDHVGAVFAEIGVEILFNKIAIKPGKPTTFGIRKNDGAAETLVFGVAWKSGGGVGKFSLIRAHGGARRCGATDPLPKWHTLPLMGRSHRCGGPDDVSPGEACGS